MNEEYMKEFEIFRDYNRIKFRSSIVEKGKLTAICPHCNNGPLDLAVVVITNQETAESDRVMRQEWSELCHVEYSFCGTLECPSCHKHVQCTGRGSIFEASDENGEEVRFDTFSPQYFFPTIPVFKVHNETPDDVKELLMRSFKLAWADSSAAGNLLRCAVEKWLDGFEPKKAKGFDSLGERLTRMKNGEHKDAAEMLDAIRWLGNAASHEAILEESDLAFGYKIFERVLNDQFEVDLDAMVEKVKLRKGPIRWR